MERRRRNTELSLLFLAAIVIVSAYVLASLGRLAALPANIVPFLGIILGLLLLAHVATRRLAPAADPLLLPVDPPGTARLLSEAEAKAALAGHGLRVPASRRCADQAEVDTADVPFPVVLKGEGFAHKSEVGAVKLNLRSADELSRAAAEMQAEGYLVEEMITGGVAELIVGVVRDPAHGYVLTLGAGGVLTELLEDSASLLVPASRDAVGRALDGLRCARLLQGYRGAPAADRHAIIDAVMAVQDYVTANAGTVLEVEVNPLICTPDGAVAADALIRIMS